MMDKQQCTKCGGDGFRKNLLDKTVKCIYCDGVGSFPSIDEIDILHRIMVKRGKKNMLRKSPAGGKRKTVAERRAYYVWRLARFHGGADTSMPVVATMECDGDPYIDELDALSDRVAKQAFGTHFAAAYQWGKVLGAHNALVVT